MTSEILKARLARAFDLTNALAGDLSSDALRARNGKAKSNSIGSQFWCLVGARESYTRAIKAGVWAGFDCSLGDEGAHDPAALKAALMQSTQSALTTINSFNALNDAQLDLLISLNEHEVQHHGQLIRYFYANDLAFPAAFADRYAL